MGGDAAVHGDEQRHSLLVEGVNGRNIEAVALLHAAGDVEQTVAALLPQELGQKTGGRDAVHIVITENGNAFAVFQRLPHPLGGGGQIGHGLRGRQWAVHRKEVGGLPGRGAAPAAQHRRRQGRETGFPEVMGRCGVITRHIPASILQNKYTSKYSF